MVATSTRNRVAAVINTKNVTPHANVFVNQNEASEGIAGHKAVKVQQALRVQVLDHQEQQGHKVRLVQQVQLAPSEQQEQ